jgi:RNA polymerase sigma-70 factor (ECF subfamily)
METQSDGELIRRYRKGDERALSILIQRHLDAVYRFARRMVNDASLADDIAQDTFVKAWRHLGRFKTSKSFRTWVLSIAKNTAIDALRKKNPIAFSQLETEEQTSFADTIPDSQPLAFEMLERQDSAHLLEDALMTLPPKSRSIVLMHETENLTFQDIADAMHEPMNTVKSRYRRALELLRRRLKSE